MKKLLLLLAWFVSLLFGTQTASSLTINLIYIGGTPPTNSVGTGDLITIMTAARDIWQLAIRDDHTVTIYYGWANVGGGQHVLLTQCCTPNRETSGQILFNNDNDPGHNKWYLDPTPYSCSDATNYVEKTVNLGTGPINAGRNYLYPASSQHLDLLTVALHEIGHALGMSYGNFSFMDECGDGYINTTRGPYPWIAIPMQINFLTGLTTSHIEYIGDCNMSGSFCEGSRMMPTVIDIVALAQLSGFTQLNLELAPELKISPPYPISGGKRETKLSWIQPIPLPTGQKWIVQSCSDLAQGSWSKVNGTIVNSNGKYSMAVQVSGSQKYFRLKIQ